MPHDALFKTIFSDPEHAAAELRAVLPAALAARVDWSTLELEPGSFVDERFRGQHTDLLFSVKIDGREARIYVLFEHQSSADRWMPLRMLAYEVRIWSALVTREPKRDRLPPVIPVVLHHGEGGWTASTELFDLVDVEEGDPLASVAPRFSFFVDDLGRLSDAELLARALPATVALALLALRDARTMHDARAWLRRFAELLRAVLAARRGPEALAAIVRYILLVQRTLDVEALAEEAESIAIGAGEPIMTTAQKLIEQGEAKGELQGRRALLAKQLTLRFGPLPEPTRARLDAADVATLDRWAERVLTAASLADVID